MPIHHPGADALKASLRRDPRSPDPPAIAVSVEGGVATLRGTVESFPQRRAAAEDARRIEGVYHVDDQLKVELPLPHRRDDHEIRGAALQALMWDVQVPSDSIEVEVHHGWVTLTGEVEAQFESDAAYEDAARLQGVVHVTNEIKVNAH